MHQSLAMLYPFIMTYFLFVNMRPTTEIYTLSLHDALPIFVAHLLDALDLLDDLIGGAENDRRRVVVERLGVATTTRRRSRSEEHTSELQSRQYLVCRLLLEKKKHARCNHTQDLRVRRQAAR